MYSIHYIIKKILFPRHCVGCHKTGQALCSDCLALLPFLTKIYQKNNHIEILLLPYNHKKVTPIIWEMKYKNNTDIRKVLFSRINKELNLPMRTLLKNADTVCVISVPKTKKDGIKNRDFDHGFLLAQAFIPCIENCSVQKIFLLENMLTKKDIVRQATQKSKTLRIKGIHGSIEPTAHLKNKAPVSTPLIIIDDVMTTGATRDEMIRVLRKYFIGKIIFVAIAH